MASAGATPLISHLMEHSQQNLSEVVDRHEALLGDEGLRIEMDGHVVIPPCDSDPHMEVVRRAGHQTVAEDLESAYHHACWAMGVARSVL